MARLVGITGYKGPTELEGYLIDHQHSQHSYTRAVLKAGDTPVIVPELEPDQVDALLDRLDAIVLIGGPDVDPVHYGEPRDELTIPASEGRDLFDLALARRCVERNHPLLAICRGVQVLNVALGGSLVQHLDDHHRLDVANDTAHEVTFDTGSPYPKVMGGDVRGTNTLHHQAIGRPGDGVRIVGHAPDGTPEAVIVEDAPNVLGVQWHPELLRHRPEHLALFQPRD